MKLSSSSLCKNVTKEKGKEVRLAEMEKLDIIQVLHQVLPIIEICAFFVLIDSLPEHSLL